MMEYFGRINYIYKYYSQHYLKKNLNKIEFFVSNL